MSETEATEAAKTVFEIPAANLPGLMFKLTSLSKRSTRILGSPIELQMRGEVRKPYMVTRKSSQMGVDTAGKVSPHNKNGWVQAVDAEGNFIWDIFYEVAIDSPTPTIEGWTFVATIDHSAAAGNLIRVVPNTVESVPEKYRTVKPVCDHCGKIRSRRDTYLLRCDATGELKQIGAQCIKDFIPGANDPRRMLQLAEYLASASPSDSDADLDWVGGMRDNRYIFVKTYLAHTAAVIHKFGWVSRKDAEIRQTSSTAGDAHYNMFPPKECDRSKLIPVTDRDLATADAALEWANTPGALNSRKNYEYNLSILAQETLVEGRSMGLLASLIPTYYRHKEQEFKRAERNRLMKVGDSQHVGQVGQRLRDVEATLFGYKSFNGGMYVSHMYKMQTAEGNILVWFASEDAAPEIGGLDATNRIKVRVTGTVKKHDVYQDVNQTILSRCRITRIDDIATTNETPSE